MRHIDRKPNPKSGPRKLTNGSERQFHRPRMDNPSRTEPSTSRGRRRHESEDTCDPGTPQPGPTSAAAASSGLNWQASRMISAPRWASFTPELSAASSPKISTRAGMCQMCISALASVTRSAPEVEDTSKHTDTSCSHVLDYVLDHVIDRPLTDIGAVRYLPFHRSSRSRGESAKHVEHEMGNDQSTWGLRRRTGTRQTGRWELAAYT